MSFRENKIEIAIAGFAVVLFGGMGYLLKSPVQAVMNEIEVIYEMPRPKSFLASLFELGDREISREYKNPFAKKDGKSEEVAKNADKKQGVMPVAAAKKAVAKKKTEEKKPSVDVQIVGADPTGPKVGADDFGGSAFAPAVGGVATQSAPQNSSTEDGNAETNGMSAEQWRALILAQPTAANIAKLVVAYSKQEVDEQTFYTIVTDLFRNNKTETQEMGLTAASSVYSAKSFAVVAEYYDQLTADLQKKAHTYLMTYGTSSRLGYLKTALTSASAEVVSTATEVAIAGYQAAKANGGATAVANDRGGSRGGEAGSVNAIAAYAQLIPVFQQLAASQDSTIAGLAASALNQIQVSVAAL